MKVRISFIGNLVADMKFEYKGKMPTAKGCIAINEYVQKDGKKVQKTIFLDFVTQGEVALIHQHTKKSTTLSVVGYLTQSARADKNGDKHLSNKVVATNVRIMDKYALECAERISQAKRPDYVLDDKGCIIGIKRFKDGVVIYTPEYKQRMAQEAEAKSK